MRSRISWSRSSSLMTFAIEALLLSIPPTVHLGGSSDLGKIAGRSTTVLVETFFF
jgi:hypothetical protein